MKIKFQTIVLLVMLTAVIITFAQVVESRTVRDEMKYGDRQQEWAFVYFESWRKHHDASYLVQSRDHMESAVSIWFELQIKIGHTYPDFYMIDDRRRRGCQFLAEIDRLALKFNVPLSRYGSNVCQLSG